MNNPFLSDYNTPFKTIPFNEIKLEHYKPAIEKGIELGKQEIEAIKAIVIPTFSNTIEVLEKTGSLINKVAEVFFNLNSAETSDELQQLAQELSPMLTAYSNDISLDEKLFENIKKAYEATDVSTLSVEQKMLLEKTYKGFVRSGANLSPDKKNVLRDINTKLSTLGLVFGENVLKDSNKYELHILNENDLAGLPEGVKEAAAMTAKAKDKKSGWIFTLDYPSYIPFMQYAENRELRKQLFLAFGTKAYGDSENSNEKTVLEIVSLKNKRAQLLGYKSHAEFTLEERMAINPSNVYKLFDDLLTPALPIAKKELEEIQELATKLNGPKKIDRWDFSYYSEKLKKEKFNIDDEILKPYFQLEKVTEGAFQTATNLYNISFKERTDIQKYHDDVKTYEVLDENGTHLSILYADFFPREGKRNGAWMTSYRGQSNYNNEQQRPLISIVCNFTKPTETKPSLLTFNEVTTLFHEFGHALHGVLANGHYESLSGTSVYWDFVELPSQLMENWCYEKECLDLFAKHYETGETIPLELVQKIKDSANFLSGYQTVRQVSLGKLDMAWHDLNTFNETINVTDFEHDAGASTSLFEDIKGVNTSCSFSHIFQGGYSAGYYSYKWAEVLEADAFEFFKETGIFNKDTAAKFRNNVLAKGGSEHPMDLYKRFRGSEPKTEALIRKSGLA
jgi:Zn-dependent oligopeptidase